MSGSDSSYAFSRPIWPTIAESAHPRLLLLSCDTAVLPFGRSALAEGLESEKWPVTQVLAGRTGIDPAHSDRYPRLAYWRYLIRLLPTHDLVHINCHSAGALLTQAVPALVLARFFGKKIVLQIGVADFDELIARHRRWLMPVLKLADVLVTGSRYLQRTLTRAHLPACRLVAPAYVADLSAREVVKLQPKILIDVPLEQYHNVGGAIRAFRLVKQKYPRAELVITGAGSERTILKRMVNEQRLIGIQISEDLPVAELAECDLYVNPSLQDESPVGLVRAWAAGLPVVCADADGLLQMVRHGVNGLVVPVGDHVGLADAIIELIENQELTVLLSRQGPAEAEKQSWSRLRQDWVNLYDGLRRKKVR